MKAIFAEGYGYEVEGKNIEEIVNKLNDSSEQNVFIYRPERKAIDVYDIIDVDYRLHYDVESGEWDERDYDIQNKETFEYIREDFEGEFALYTGYII